MRKYRVTVSHLVGNRWIQSERVIQARDEAQAIYGAVDQHLRDWRKGRRGARVKKIRVDLEV